MSDASIPVRETDKSPYATEHSSSQDPAPLGATQNQDGPYPPISRSERWILAGVWLIACSLVLIAVYLVWRTQTTMAAPSDVPTLVTETETAPLSSEPVEVVLPDFTVTTQIHAISRLSLLHTIIPSRPRDDVIVYTVGAGDAVFSIAKKFNLKPETILWANYDQLNDNPDMLSVDMELNIPPVDGVYYEWDNGDTLENVAARFEVDVADILNWPGNRLDLTNPQVDPGNWVMIPGGHREFRIWLVPTIARDRAGVSKDLYGLGACDGSYEGAYGSGSFMWPTYSHVLSGNDYWSGHLGIDIAGGVGDSVWASDSGVVVFAGWATGGYGYMIMIDHGNGYQTLYAHLSNVSAYCGQSVYQGQHIGGVGSTGNSTGSHLHFEVRYLGGFISPWYVLPAP